MGSISLLVPVYNYRWRILVKFELGTRFWMCAFHFRIIKHSGLASLKGVVGGAGRGKLGDEYCVDAEEELAFGFARE